MLQIAIDVFLVLFRAPISCTDCSSEFTDDPFLPGPGVPVIQKYWSILVLITTGIPSVVFPLPRIFPGSDADM